MNSRWSMVNSRWSIVGLVAVAMLAFATPALACPVCFGAVDSPQTKAMQAGILALLGVTVAMLGAFAAFFFIYLRRRMRMFEEAAGPTNHPNAAAALGAPAVGRHYR